MSQQSDQQDQDQDELPKYDVRKDEVDFLKDKNIQILHEFLGGNPKGQVFGGQFVSEWKRELTRMEKGKKVKVKEQNIPEHAEVAIKILVLESDDLKQIEEQANHLKGLDHPNLVTIYCVLPHTGSSGLHKLFVVMERAGISLSLYLKKYIDRDSTKLKEWQAKGFVLDVIAALQALFNADLHHGDINTRNLVVFKTEKRHIVKLVAYGWPKKIEDQEERHKTQFDDLAQASVTFFALSTCIKQDEDTRASMIDLIVKTRTAFREKKKPEQVCESLRRHQWLADVEPAEETKPMIGDPNCEFDESDKSSDKNSSE